MLKKNFYFLFLGGICNHGEVKLVGGSDPSEGRIEVCVDGIWGTVDSFRLQVNIAKIVCRQLGYSDQGGPLSLSFLLLLFLPLLHYYIITLLLLSQLKLLILYREGEIIL